MLAFTDQLLAVANAYRAAKGSSLAAVSARVFDDGKRLPLVANGEGSVTLKRAEQALRWFSENWPADAEWPSDVPRPADTKQVAA